MSEQRATFRVRSIACLLTFPNYIVPLDSYDEYREEHDIVVSTYVIESHQNGQGHTHIVLLGRNKTLFDLGEIEQKFGRHPNIKRLTREADAYRAMAYSCKEKIAEVLVGPGYVRHVACEQICGHVWQYAMNARGARQRRLLEQHKRMRAEWFPSGGEHERYMPTYKVSPQIFN